MSFSTVGGSGLVGVWDKTNASQFELMSRFQ